MITGTPEELRHTLAALELQMGLPHKAASQRMLEEKIAIMKAAGLDLPTRAEKIGHGERNQRDIELKLASVPEKRAETYYDLLILLTNGRFDECKKSWFTADEAQTVLMDRFVAHFGTVEDAKRPPFSTAAVLSYGVEHEWLEQRPHPHQKAMQFRMLDDVNIMVRPSTESRENRKHRARRSMLVLRDVKNGTCFSGKFLLGRKGILWLREQCLRDPSVKSAPESQEAIRDHAEVPATEVPVTGFAEYWDLVTSLFMQSEKESADAGLSKQDNSCAVIHLLPCRGIGQIPESPRERLELFYSEFCDNAAAAQSYLIMHFNDSARQNFRAAWPEMVEALKKNLETASEMDDTDHQLYLVNFAWSPTI